MSLVNYKSGVDGKFTKEAKFGEELTKAILYFIEVQPWKSKYEKGKPTTIDFGKENKNVIDNLKNNIFFNSNTGELSLQKKEGYEKLEGLEDADIEKAIVDQKQELLGNRVRKEIFDYLFPNFNTWQTAHTSAPSQNAALIGELFKRVGAKPKQSGDSSSVVNEELGPETSTGGGVRVDTGGNNADLMTELSHRLKKPGNPSSVAHEEGAPSTSTGGGGSANSEYASAVVTRESEHLEESKDIGSSPELNSALKNIRQWKDGTQVSTIKQDLATLFNEGSAAEVMDALQINGEHATNKGGIFYRLIDNKNYNDIRKDPNLTHFGSAKFLTNLSDRFIDDLNKDANIKNKVKELAEACKTTTKSGYTRGFFGGKKSSEEIEKLNSLINKLNNGPGVAPRK